jgi:prepilin-type N-terminal cleavage/methylation domain-containing protein
MISRNSQTPKEGFTLLEIIIALAVFGFVVTGLLAFLPWAIEGKANIKDFNTACAMPDAIQIELEHLGFNDIEQATRPDGSGLYLVARRDGVEVRYEMDLDPAEIAAGDRYFLIHCIQFPSSNRLAHDPSNGWLALQVDIQWPYKVRASEDENNAIEVSSNLREHFVYPTAITR